MPHPPQKLVLIVFHGRFLSFTDIMQSSCIILILDCFKSINLPISGPVHPGIYTKEPKGVRDAAEAWSC